MALQAKNYDPAQMYGAELDTSNIPAAEIITADIAAQNITGSLLATRIGYFSVGVSLTGTDTAEFNVFGSGGLGVASSITAFVASNVENTLTATNVFLTAGEDSVGTVVLGGTDDSAAAKAPDAVLANATITAGTKLFLERNSDEIVQVVLTFEVD